MGIINNTTSCSRNERAITIKGSHRNLRWLQIVALICISLITYAQSSLPDLPEAVSNNAVVEFISESGDVSIYSFAGIGSGLSFRDIHQKSFKLNVGDDQWQVLDDLPSGPGRIAAGASGVKGLIYIMGGYQVLSTGNEISLSEVHILDPTADTFRQNGARIPIPIDDHIQAVWRDSLIYVVTGWSQNTNVTNVQVYNPALDQWSQARRVPSSGAYRVFGGSGTIIGDTIYYMGGARFGNNFPPSAYLRKGIINPKDPLDIQWSAQESVDAIGYRMAASEFMGQPIWIGGSKVTYNYDGLAYNGSGPVAPNSAVRTYDDQIDEIRYIHGSGLIPTMDFRGVAKISENKFALIGGMWPDQTVTDSCQILELKPLNSRTTSRFDLSVYPNPAQDAIYVENEEGVELEILDLKGTVVRSVIAIHSRIDIQDLSSGIYFIRASKDGDVAIQKFQKL